MSLQAIRPYISSRMSALGYVEHVDVFNDENIPSTVLDNGFHQAFINISGIEKTNSTQGFEASVQVKAFFKGYRDPEQALTQSIINGEAIIADLTLLGNYKPLDPAITAVLLESVSFEPYSLDNDNVVQAIFIFRFIVHICVE